MKKLYRSLGYHDRHELDSRSRIFMGVLCTIALLLSTRDDLVSLRKYMAELRRGQFRCSDALFTATNGRDLYLDSIFHVLGVEIPVVILFFGACLFCATVVSRGQTNGWNRYLRALPVSPAMRAKSMCVGRARQFGISTLIALVVSCTFCASFIGMKQAVALIPVILTISLTLETADMILSPFSAWIALRCEPSRAYSVAFSTALLPLLGITFVLTLFVCPGFTKWTEYSSNYHYNARWLLYIALCIALNYVAYRLLAKVLAKKID